MATYSDSFDIGINIKIWWAQFLVEFSYTQASSACALLSDICKLHFIRENDKYTYICSCVDSELEIAICLGLSHRHI